MKDNIYEMKELRKQGHTYAETGKRFGISKQRIHMLIGKDRIRKCDTDIEEIAYEGVYQMFVDDSEMTFPKLAKIMYKTTRADTAQTETARRFVRKEGKTKIALDCINNLLQYIGKPYEEVFTEREMKGGAE